MAAASPRDRILSRAHSVLAKQANPTVADFARAAGISRASFYRVFKSREALLEALEVAPDPGTKERILDAALEEVGAHGLSALSMDELADRAAVSRATLYRLFPGKAALFTGLIHAYSPLEPVTQLLTAMQHEPPEVLLPELARTVYRTVYGGGKNRIGLLRALLFEVSGLAPDTEEAARDVIVNMAGALGIYMATNMAEGRLRQMHPMLALQAFIGPIFFHLITRPVIERVVGLDMDGEQSVTELTQTWLRAMSTKETTRE
jgi:AcrR family transcriptional regulator